MFQTGRVTQRNSLQLYVHSPSTEASLDAETKMMTERAEKEAKSGSTKNLVLDQPFVEMMGLVPPAECGYNGWGDK